jgi:hypothetical protein
VAAEVERDPLESGRLPPLVGAALHARLCERQPRLPAEQQFITLAARPVYVSVEEDAQGLRDGNLAHTRD